jgi:hypothetical protein
MGDDMALDDLAGSGGENARTKWIGVWIGVLAVLLAVCTVGGDNATKDANRANIDASNLWSFFQAKNMRRVIYTEAAGDLELTLAAQPALDPAVKAKFEERIKKLKADAARMRSEPETKEGTRELAARAKALEAERDIALRKDPYFDFGGALIQIAIVLASVAIIAGTNLLLFASFGLGAVGAFLMLNGFTLLFAVPFLG